MVELVQVASPKHLSTIRALFEEYACTLGIDLGFQRFAEELRDLPGAYAPPRGVLLLAHFGADVVGCVGVRPLDATTAEMKRLYVRPAGRGRGVGRALALAAIAHAQQWGYERMRLDTLPAMAQAQELYSSLGFQPIPPYRFSPVLGTAFMELQLRVGEA
ncbi:MAG: GNAT family N-acetyltransferase [Gemmatimonadetes bacterium]|nr:GNAT family N-acetyltransferase [Gemmatimonadota bacterium]MBK7785765.1 GNAT family N-acetyltransferase [Gemmatimonadota bacterium]